MILVLEGAQGAGKTTFADYLSQRLAWPVYRAFRNDGDGHTPGAGQGWLRNVPLPVNTWMEDMYGADIYQTLQPNLILDRSMPSAITYEVLSPRPEWHRLRKDEQRQAVLVAWGQRMLKANAKIILLQGDP